MPDVSVPDAAQAPGCESCGDIADITLPDGSRWCASCDGSARRLGYDDGTQGATGPILTDCEGAGCPGHRCVYPDTHGMCQMCGQVKQLDEAGRMPPHQRQDVLAMLARGDFDG